jgi:hypothetical protein
VDKPAKGVGSSWLGEVEMADCDGTVARGLQRPLLEGPVRPVAVVVLEVVREVDFEVARPKTNSRSTHYRRTVWVGET